MSATNSAKSKSISSVPLAVYRELATELQLTQAQLAFYRHRWEQANQQRQELICEVQHLVEATQKIQAIISACTNENADDEDNVSTNQLENAIPQVGVAPQIINQETAKTEIKLYWIVIMVLAVLVLSFGAGFILMNSVSGTRQQRP